VECVRRWVRRCGEVWWALEARWWVYDGSQMCETASKCVLFGLCWRGVCQGLVTRQLMVFLTVVVRIKSERERQCQVFTPIGCRPNVTAIVSKAPAFNSYLTSTFKLRALLQTHLFKVLHFEPSLYFHVGSCHCNFNWILPSTLSAS
jgi:hypothetical protein